MATIKSKVLERVRKQLEALLQLEAEVGVLENTRPYRDSDISVVEVATIHEFGTEHIAERSFLRVPIREHKNDIATRTRKDKYRQLLTGEITPEEFMAYLGELAVGVSREAFDTQGFGEWDPHEKSTEAHLKRRGVTESRLLQDTGALKKSVTYRVVKK